MELESQLSASTDEYFMTAHQIFDYCGVDSTGFIEVETLMEQFAPFVKTNEAEYSYLKSLLDPEQCNPEITVSNLARALTKYSESQKAKLDLDESFNLKGGPLDSDSGISTDGFQILEELQSELREKSHLAHQLRNQLDFTDRQHEEAIATLTAERDSLREHLNTFREENTTLLDIRRDYQDTCERLSASEQALADVRREQDTLRRKCKVLGEQVARLENEKLTLQDLLQSSKEECHRINEMYASRQSALIEESEALRAERAVLTATLRERDEYMQHTIKEKVLLEMELKDIINKSNQTQLRHDRSIDVSFTEDQILSALDSIHADSKFMQESELLDEESFNRALLDEHRGRSTNISLFDELRMSFSNLSRTNNADFFGPTECSKCREILDTSFTTIGTQTDVDCDKTELCASNKNADSCNLCAKNKHLKTQAIGTQTDSRKEPCVVINKARFCYDCMKLNNCKVKLEKDLSISHGTIAEMQTDLQQYEANLDVLQRFVNEENEKNSLLQTVVNNLKSKIVFLEKSCLEQKKKLDSFGCTTSSAGSQTIPSDVANTSSQADIPCTDCEQRRALVPKSAFRKYFWEPIKGLFQLFAVVCFLCAISVLYGITKRWHSRCGSPRETVPWKWLDIQDLMDLFFRIEYVSEVPM